MDPPVTSGKAIASLVLGGMFFFACFSGAPAILLGWAALWEINRSKGRLCGAKIAVAGTVLGLIGCLCTLAIVLPAFRSAETNGLRAQCTNNLKQIGLGLHNMKH